MKMRQVELEFPSRDIEVRSSCAYRIGSRGRYIVRLTTLLTASSGALVALYWVLARLTEWSLFVFMLIVVLTVIRRALNRNAAGMWALFILKDSAYGWATESGIVYQILHRKNAIHWSEIEQLDYAPSTGRVTVYIRNRVLPLQFGPSHQVLTLSQRSSLIALLSHKIHCSGGTFVEQRS